MNRISNKLSAVFFLCMSLVLLSILFFNSYFLTIVLLVIGWWLNRHTIKHFTAAVLIGGVVLRIGLALVIRPPVESDFYVLRKAALMMLDGDFSFQHWEYFTLWAYQTAFVAWEAFWLRLWSSNACLVLVNAVLASGTVCLLYRLVRRFVSENAAQIAAFLLTVFPFALTLHTLLSNQIPSAFFLVLGVWVLLSDDCARLGFARYPLAGFALQCGNILRGEGIIIVAAVLAWFVFELIRTPKQWMRLFLCIAVLLAVYFSVGWLADYGVRAAGWNSSGLKNNDLAWKFITGLNPETSGGYSEEDWERILSTLDENHHLTDATKALQDGILSERLHRTPSEWSKFFSDKLRLFWNEDALFWVFGHFNMEYRLGPITSGNVYDWIRTLDRCMFFSCLVLSALGCLELHRKRETLPAAAYFPYFVVFAAFFAFLPIEVQSRYAFLPQLFLFFTAAYGVDWLRCGMPFSAIRKQKTQTADKPESLEMSERKNV